MKPSAAKPLLNTSTVFSNPTRYMPKVARKDPAWTFALGCLGVTTFGAVVFMSLSQGRLQTAQAQDQAHPPQVQAPPAQNPPPQLQSQAPPSTSALMPPPPQVTPPPVTLDDSARLHAPTLIVDFSESAGPDAPPAAAAGKPGAPSTGVSPNDPKATAEERFADKAANSTIETAKATRLRDTALIAPQGTIIPAILETALNSDLPGFVRAVVTRDVRGFDNSTVLIPRGSKLVGQYKSAVSAGQSRAFVVWNRLLTPDGVSIELGSPGADELGRAGMAGETNTHFLRRFGSSIMLSVISAALASASNGNNNNNTAIVIGTPQAANNVATVALSKDIDIPDTIEVKQGVEIRVLVAKDLDFSGVMARSKP